MKKTWRLAVPLSALALLAGCVPWGGTAFTVDGNPVSSRAVDTAVSSCAAALQSESSPDLRLNMVSWMIAAQVADRVADKTNQTVTDAERLQFLNAIRAEVLLTEAECAKVANGFATYNVLGQRISLQTGQAAFEAEVDKINVQVNPRYGSWGTSQGQWKVVNTGSLSTPAPTQTTNP